MKIVERRPLTDGERLLWLAAFPGSCVVWYLTQSDLLGGVLLGAGVVSFAGLLLRNELRQPKAERDRYRVGAPWTGRRQGVIWITTFAAAFTAITVPLLLTESPHGPGEMSRTAVLLPLATALIAANGAIGVDVWQRRRRSREGGS